MPDPATIAAIADAAAQAASLLGAGGDNEEVARIGARTQRDKDLIALILESLNRARANQREQRQLGVRAPLAQSAIRQGRSGGALERTLGARQRQLAAGGGQQLAPGADATATPDQLQPLIIRGIGDVQRMKADAQRLTQGITAENLFVPREDPLEAIRSQFPGLHDALIGTARGNTAENRAKVTASGFGPPETEEERQRRLARRSGQQPSGDRGF